MSSHPRQAGYLAFDGSVSGRAFTLGGLTGSGNLSLQNNAVAPAGVALSVGNNNGSTIYSGQLSGLGGLTKVGSGELTLTGANSYANGTTVNSGTLAVTYPGALSGYATPSMVTVYNGGMLAVSVGGTGWAATDVGNLLAANGSNFFAGATLGIDTTNANFTYGALSGNLGLTKLGANTLTLTAASSFSGLTTVSGGTLLLANAGALQGSTLMAPTAGSLVFSSSVASNAFTFGGLSGSGNLSLQNNAGTSAPIVLTVGGGNTNTTYFGALSGSGSLVKVGSAR